MAAAGSLNTASGLEALQSNTTGSDNTAGGQRTLSSNTTGGSNTATGFHALLNNTTGSNNIGLSVGAGQNLTTGSNNIEIGHVGVAAESKTIRIGTQGTQTATFIAGISGVPVSGAAVEVSSTGQLGIVMLSARYKHDIRDLGEASSNLLRLRPVSFRYNNDPSNTVQYGLVAEEVAKIYPELVVYGPDGKVMTVRYSMLSAMLLNELQKQNKVMTVRYSMLSAMLLNELQKQNKVNERQAAQVTNLSAQMVAMRLSNRREVAGLKPNYERDLRSIQERLAAMEQAMGKTNGRKLAAAFDR